MTLYCLDGSCVSFRFGVIEMEDGFGVIEMRDGALILDLVS